MEKETLKDVRNGINEVTTTLRISAEKHSEFKEYAKYTNVSLNTAFKVAASLGLKMLKGEFRNVALVETPRADCSTVQT